MTKVIWLDENKMKEVIWDNYCSTGINYFENLDHIVNSPTAMEDAKISMEKITQLAGYYWQKRQEMLNEIKNQIDNEIGWVYEGFNEEIWVSMQKQIIELIYLNYPELTRVETYK